MSGPQTPVDLEVDFDTLAVDPEHEKKVQEEQAIIQGGDEDELERFRREWRAEVKTKRREVDVGGDKWKEAESKAVPIDQQPRLGRAQQPSPKRTSETMLPTSLEREVSPTRIKGPSSLASTRSPQAGPSRPKTQASAVQLYAQAVENEQSGQLNDALLLYRRAFKIDDNVDRVYQRSLPKPKADAKEDEASTPTSTDIVSASAPKDEPYSFQRHLQFQPDYQKTHAHVTRKRSPLSALFDKASVPIDEAAFLPENEDKPLPLSTLPAELLEPIFSHLDVGSLERFALTCWRARYLSSRAAMWKRRTQEIYRWPMVTDEGTTAADLSRRHDGEWRTTFIEEERVRMDGCYISVCHYVRPGAGDEWVAVTHMITYHRFLRFCPDGTVISFLTTDHPSQVVPVLRPSLRSKGLHFGRWRLEKSKVIVTQLLEPGNHSPKYEFEMELSLKETQRGRWNKLDIDSYRSINLANEEVLALSLKHQKPFYFSKVKSYHPSL